ncbi:MAG: RNA methyltransferase, partial [Pseudomonadota bacterium]
MAYDEQLANWFRNNLQRQQNISETRMMGGICFLINGNMIGGADRTKEGVGRYMFRLGKEKQAIG